MKENLPLYPCDPFYPVRWEPYYRSELGKFMLELGLNQAQEFLQADLLRMQKRKLEKMKTQPSREGIVSMIVFLFYLFC